MQRFRPARPEFDDVARLTSKALDAGFRVLAGQQYDSTDAVQLFGDYLLDAFGTESGRVAVVLWRHVLSTLDAQVADEADRWLRRVQPRRHSRRPS